MKDVRENFIKHPETEKNESAASIAKVLKISEMALSVDGVYVDEVGNPSYEDRKDMFEYDPEKDGGLLINGREKTIMLSNDDLVKLPYDLGHISITSLLGNKRGRFSGREFEREIYTAYENIKNQIDKIIYIARIAGVNLNEDTVNFRCTEMASKKNKQYGPEELMDAILNELKREIDFLSPEIIEEKRLANIVEGIKNTNIINKSPEERKRAVVSYFYLYCRLKNIDVSNTSALVRALEGFRYIDELIEEYEKNPDDRFGDALLVACSEFKKLEE